MTSKSLYNNGRSVMKRDAAMLEAEAAERQAAVVAANRERLRMDAPAVDPALVNGAKAVYVRGQGWCLVTRVNPSTVTVNSPAGYTFRVPFSQIVDYR